MARTASPYQLPDAIGDLTATISGLNTDQLSTALQTLATTLQDTPPQLKVAVEGVSRFSQTLSQRDAQLRGLLSNARKATTVLADRTDKIVLLIRDTDTLLAALREQSAALDQISQHVSSLAQQIEGLIGENRATLKPALDKLNGVLATLDNRKAEIQKAIKGMNNYALSFGEASGGPLLQGLRLQPAAGPVAATICRRGVLGSGGGSEHAVALPTYRPTRSVSPARLRCRFRIRGPDKAGEPRTDTAGRYYRQPRTIRRAGHRACRCPDPGATPIVTPDPRQPRVVRRRGRPLCLPVSRSPRSPCRPRCSYRRPVNLLLPRSRYPRAGVSDEARQGGSCRSGGGACCRPRGRRTGRGAGDA